MMKFLSVALLAGALSISACVKDVDIALKVASGCDAISAALRTLTPLKADMSESQIDIVDNVIVVTDPICTSSTPPDSAMGLVDASLVSLTILLTDLALQ